MMGAPAEHESLAALLAPRLIEACDGRLSDIQWFRSAWQAGGASTGYARYASPDGQPADVVIKLPVGPSEFRWTTELSKAANGSCDACTPRVFAGGTEIGGYDLAWLVIEKLPGSPLSAGLDVQAIEDLLQAAARWYVASAHCSPVTGPAPTRENWGNLVGAARDRVKTSGIAEEQRWNEVLKHVQRILPRATERWDARPINTWCHGDLHPGNAMRREGCPPGHGCVLIDLALVHPGHWVEDAVYLERLYWAKPEMLFGIKPVSAIAKHLRAAGLIGAEDYGMLANVRRLLMAATVPLYLEHEGHPRYVHAALETLERLLPAI